MPATDKTKPKAPTKTALSVYPDAEFRAQLKRMADAENRPIANMMLTLAKEGYARRRLAKVAS